MVDRVEQLNSRLVERLNVSKNPTVLFSPRPSPTKYVKMPVVYDPMPSSVKIKNRTSELSFFPTDSMAPGALDKTDIESNLKNIGFALQKNDRAVYVPSSKSDLYTETKLGNQGERQPHPLLFTHVVTKNTGIPSNLVVPTQIFNNVRLRTAA
jgi:hypothetical protein